MLREIMKYIEKTVSELSVKEILVFIAGVSLFIWILFICGEYTKYNYEIKLMESYLNTVYIKQ